MTPQGKKVWSSPAGVRLLDNLLEGRPPTKQDEETVKALVKTSKEGQKQQEPKK
jgi:hypothetical protein